MSRLRNIPRTIGPLWRRWGQRWIDAVLPPVCDPATGDPAKPFWSPDEPEVYCWRCAAGVGAFVVDETGCPACRNLRLPWVEAVRLGAYEPPLDGFVRGMKFAGQWAWGPWLGQRLGEAIVQRRAEPHWPSGKRRASATEADPSGTLFCFVPMPWRRRIVRGYNQGQLIAQAAAKAVGGRCLPLLSRRGYTPPQTHVAPSLRRRNAGRAYAVRPVNLRGREVWLIDDVTTTTSTLRAGARLLRRRGARVHLGVVAVASRRAGA